MSTSRVPLQAGEVVRIRDERWRIVRRITHDGATAIEAAGCDVGNRSAHATFLLPFDTIERFQVSAARVVGRRRWRRAARHTLATASARYTSLRAATFARLRIISFQLEPAMALVRGEACRFLIADAVGLGKTVQAGLMIAETLARRPDGRVLVVTPAALREQWREEIESRFGLGADILDAAGIARLTSRLPAGINPWSVRRVAITSMDYIKRPEVMRSIEPLLWDIVVLDEAHNLTGRSDRSAAAAAIGNRARALVLLTATPHSGDDQAFDRLCRLGDLGRAHRLLVFKRTRRDVGLPHARRDTLLRVRPTIAEVEMHRTLMAYAKLVWNRSSDASGAGAQLAMSVLARRACSSAASLVRSVERRLGLLGQASSMPDIQLGLPFVNEVIDDEEPAVSLRSPGLPDAEEERRYLLRVLDRARDAATAESKLAALRRLISRVNEPAIVFTEYRDTLREISATLSGVETVQLHGGLTSRERNDALRRFTDGTVRVLLATDAASEGLNLQKRCRLVVNLELPWTPLRLEQRAGRVDRIGQARTVHVVRFAAQGTCEEMTVVRLALRIARIESAMEMTSPIPNERRVAESVLGGAPIPEIEPATGRRSTGISTIDLAEDAAREGERIVSARGLLDADQSMPTDTRAVIANLHRRRTRSAPRCFWVFGVTVSSSSGELVCEPLVALAAELRHPVGQRRRDIRRCVTSDSGSIEQALFIAQSQMLLELRHALRRPVALWVRREQDLMAELRDCRARLAAGLMQRSLFDNRRHRSTASQSALLDEALSQSECRLQDLEAHRAIDVESHRLAFAAVIE